MNADALSYAALSAGVLFVVALLAGLLTWATPKPFRANPRAVLGAASILITMTAVFDNVIIGVGLVSYDPHRISGVLIGMAPIEDFAYSFAAALLAPILWQFLAARGSRT